MLFMPFSHARVQPDTASNHSSIRCLIQRQLEIQFGSIKTVPRPFHRVVISIRRGRRNSPFQALLETRLSISEEEAIRTPYRAAFTLTGIRAFEGQSSPVRCRFVTRRMWNMRRRHSSHRWLIPAARTAVKGARLSRVHRSEAQTLDGRRSGGYARCAPLRPSLYSQYS
jgi:hypothetical protein